MEGRAHRSYNDRRMSRLERDLSTSPLHPGVYMNGDSATMLRRMIPQGQIPHVCIVGAGISGGASCFRYPAQNTNLSTT